MQKVIRILTIYRQWLLSQASLDFDELYHNFWNQYEMNITAVSLLLLPRSHSKDQEIARIDATIEMINDLGTSYIFNDVQTNSVGFAVKNTIYPVQKILFILFYVRVWKNYIVTVRKEKILSIVKISKNI
ncbi:hypothetical protein IMAU30143_01219 [Lactobacillus helveticus]|uniref:hypothetical protein n=2 Tax=Lactobacillus helveticus TaxID=1587 RepID=UPI0015624466|nr:hypothetical protein [Lactobacillus helveticus]NRO31006.1 hypothetical protein [Lactobacillus helveticus]NRO36999.1 hypothetical protein [Lactobacillus helveticus]